MITKMFMVVSFLLLTLNVCNRQETNQLELDILEDEYWWAGLSSHGHQYPYNASSEVEHDFWGDNDGNQAQPLLLSSKGRYVWSEEPLKYKFSNGKITVSVKSGGLVSGQAGNNLRTAYDFAVKNFFPPNGKIPAEIMFTVPQYNTWIELVYNQNEEDILKYAQSIIDNGYPPGVLMIDDNWQEDYGVWKFSPKKFKDPKGMIEKLHKMGFKVMLWVCPFVSPDSEVFRELSKNKMLILDAEKKQDVLWANTNNKAAIIRWWNGASACLDLSNPETMKWFKNELDFLISDYGVDGFKFDAGDADFYTDNIVAYKNGTPNDQTMLFAKIGLDYPLNEYRAAWKMAGQPLAQRLRDKTHKWEDLQKIIPDLMTQSLMGYAYTCPDMIGGGEYQSFQNLATMDEELIVRSAQIHALMPMMQFSVAPWRVLSEENNRLCLEAALLHTKMGDVIINLAKEASKTGEPIVKSMALAFPNEGYEMIKDQFLLGKDIIVAPIIEKGARSRRVVLPKGEWVSDKAEIYSGGKSIEVSVPLDRLPYFKKVSN